MTYNDIFLRRNLLINIPLMQDGNKLPKGTAASVMLLRVAYQNKVDEFIKTIQDVQKALKKDGYDDRAQAVAEMRRTDAKQQAHDQWDGTGEQPAAPTEEELAKAEKTRADILPDFEAEKQELEEATQEAQTKKAAEKVEMKNATLTRSELADLYELLGTDGTIDYHTPGKDEADPMPREMFLGLIAANLVA